VRASVGALQRFARTIVAISCRDQKKKGKINKKFRWRVGFEYLTVPHESYSESVQFGLVARANLTAQAHFTGFFQEVLGSL
jgi:hypothetical protein